MRQPLKFAEQWQVHAMGGNLLRPKSFGPHNERLCGCRCESAMPPVCRAVIVNTLPSQHAATQR